MGALRWDSVVGPEGVTLRWNLRVGFEYRTIGWDPQGGTLG